MKEKQPYVGNPVAAFLVLVQFFTTYLMMVILRIFVFRSPVTSLLKVSL